jgi:hypothetical protein
VTSASGGENAADIVPRKEVALRRDPHRAIEEAIGLWDCVQLSSGCEMCRILCNSLEDANARFVRAISHVGTLTGRGMPEGFQAALREAECLRMEYQDLQAELERHRAEHHSRSSPRQDPSTG